MLNLLIFSICSSDNGPGKSDEIFKLDLPLTQITDGNKVVFAQQHHLWVVDLTGIK
ncbi:hypothetical protein KAR48_09580 [bacterium]|nr:hypothetical protein [bacterium]